VGWRTNLQIAFVQWKQHADGLYQRTLKSKKVDFNTDSRYVIGRLSTGHERQPYNTQQARFGTPMNERNTPRPHIAKVSKAPIRQEVKESGREETRSITLAHYI